MLPSDKVLIDRKTHEVGLTRPEIAVLMAHSKNSLKQYILDSDLCDDDYLSRYIELAFPRMLRTRYRRYMDSHRLRRTLLQHK